MEQQVQKSCWSTMAWTVVALGSVLALVYLFGGFDASVVASR